MSKFTCPKCKTKASFIKAITLRRSSKLTCRNCGTISIPVFWKPALTGGIGGLISGLVIVFGSWEIIKSCGAVYGSMTVFSIIAINLLVISYVVYKTTTLKVT